MDELFVWGVALLAALATIGGVRLALAVAFEWARQKREGA